jgi:hypothetical protein
MTVIATALKHLMAAGLSGDALVAAIEEIEADLVAQAPAQFADAAAERKRAYDREYRRNEREDRRNRTTSHDSPDANDLVPKEYISNPPVSPVEASASTTPHRRKETGIAIPPDWTPPPIAELSEKAREYAQRWPAGRYETEAEGFVAFWINDGRRRPDWRLTWISWIIRIHHQVMRDARFAPPSAPNGHGHRPRTAADIRNGIKRAEDNNDPDRVAELTAELAAHQAEPIKRRESTGPPRSIGQIVQQSGIRH